jgi:hypothetical protein
MSYHIYFNKELVGLFCTQVSLEAPLTLHTSYVVANGDAEKNNFCFWGQNKLLFFSAHGLKIQGRGYRMFFAKIPGGGGRGGQGFQEKLPGFIAFLLASVLKFA